MNTLIIGSKEPSQLAIENKLVGLLASFLLGFSSRSILFPCQPTTSCVAVNSDKNDNDSNIIKNGHDSDNNKMSRPTDRHIEPVAICGMAMRLPNGVKTPEAYWDVLYHGKDMRSPVPMSRYNIKGFNGDMGKTNTIQQQHAYFLEDDLAAFDAGLFTMVRESFVVLEKSAISHARERHKPAIQPGY